MYVLPKPLMFCMRMHCASWRWISGLVVWDMQRFCLCLCFSLCNWCRRNSIRSLAVGPNECFRLSIAQVTLRTIISGVWRLASLVFFGFYLVNFDVCNLRAFTGVSEFSYDCPYSRGPGMYASRIMYSWIDEVAQLSNSRFISPPTRKISASSSFASW